MTCDKIPYPNRHLANEHRKNLGKNKKIKTSVYECPHCGMFHVATIHPHKKKRTALDRKLDKYPLKTTDIPKHTEPQKEKKFYPAKKGKSIVQQSIETTYKPFQQIFNANKSNS